MVFRLVFFIMTALALLGFGTVAWFAMRPQQPPAVAALVTPLLQKKMLVTAHALAAGAMLKPEDITSADIAAGDTTGAVSAEGPDAVRSIAGSMVKRALPAGQPIRADDLMKPGDHGFMAAVLRPNMRAVTIGVDATSGSAGLVGPGDRVDLILTQTLTDPALPPGRRVAAETVLTNARVIAIDQQIMRGEAPSGGGQARTVTLEVTPEQVQRVSVAMRLGRLSLSVRAVAANQPEDAPAAGAPARGTSIYARDVSAALGGEAQAAPPGRTVRVYQGVAEPKEFKY